MSLVNVATKIKTSQLYAANIRIFNRNNFDFISFGLVHTCLFMQHTQNHTLYLSIRCSISMLKKALSILCLLSLLLCSSLVYGKNDHNARTASIAVASNFSPVMRVLAEQFEQQTQHRLKLSYASSGKLYAQIKHGAPFDAFLSADQKKTLALLRENLAVNNSEFTYAIGRLALWSAHPGFHSQHQNRLQSGQFSRLALANPKLAPYGEAALQTLSALELNKTTRKKWVQGENITQTYQFVATQNADLGFVSLSQLTNNPEIISASYWIIPETLYTPIKQDAVLLKTGENNAIAISFLAFLKSTSAQNIIESYGYLKATQH